MNVASTIFLSTPIEIGNICKVYPPLVEDVIRSSNFSQFKAILTISQEDIDDLKEGEKFQDINTPFDFLMANYLQNEFTNKIVTEGFHFFTREILRILPQQGIIWFLDDLEEITAVEDLRVLREEDYFSFQNAIRAAIGEKIIPAPDPNEDPRITRMKAKARRRDRIKEKQAAEKGQSISLETFLSALCCMGIGITPLNIGEISYASMMLLLRTYQEQEKYRVDMQLIAGGADPKKIKPKYWIRNLKD